MHIIYKIIFFLLLSPAFAGETFYSPEVNLREKDIALISNAKSTLRFAAFVLTDEYIIQSLAKAAKRGVNVQIVLDKREKENGYSLLKPILPLIRFKRSGYYMHLKSYVVDDHILRSGSANFSEQGLTKQDNNLTIERENPVEIQKFIQKFEVMWAEFAIHRQVPQNGCDIKGRINKNEKFYYLKGQKGYANIKMDNAVWFCSIIEAQEEGYKAKY